MSFWRQVLRGEGRYPHPKTRRRLSRRHPHRYALILLVLWLVIEVPVTCPHGPMSLFGAMAHELADRHAGHSEMDLAAGNEPSSSLMLVMTAPKPASAEKPIWECDNTIEHVIQSTAANGVLMTLSLSVGLLLIGILLPPLMVGLAILPAALVVHRLLSIPPPEHPPRPLRATPIG